MSIIACLETSPLTDTYFAVRVRDVIYSELYCRRLVPRCKVKHPSESAVSKLDSQK